MSRKIQDKIKKYILRLIDESCSDIVSKTVETFNISKSTVYNYIKMLKDDEIIEKNPQGKPRYVLKSKRYQFVYDRSDGRKLREERIFEDDIAPLLKDLKDNVYRAWRYAFTEIMNNAIEHSGADNISCIVEKNPRNTSMTISDNGIGIFKNIQQYVKRESGEDLTLSECAQILLAGKFTTAKEGHSGEGIFFTSHIMDSFLIISDGAVFTRTNFKDVQLDMEISENKTIVFMQLSNNSQKTMPKIFDLFSDIDEGFFRTQIPIAHMFPNGDPVSRSEARRLGEIIYKFKEVILDFTGVLEVGQAFVHELFVVWQRNAPGVKLKIENANETVLKMIKRVLKA